MTSFKDKEWNERVKGMGDQAEAIFEDVFVGKFERTGFNRPKNITMSALPATVRYLPDYITDEGWYEVQGFGWDLTAKFKLEKLDALEMIHHGLGHEVRFFLWCSSTQEWAIVHLYDVVPWVDQIRRYGKIPGMSLRSFPEGKEYLAVQANRFSGWQPYDPS